MIRDIVLSSTVYQAIKFISNNKLSQFSPLLYSVFYGVKNVSKEKTEALRKLFNDIAAGENTEFTKFAGTKDLYLVGTTSQMSTKEMVGFVNETANHWR